MSVNDQHYCMCISMKKGEAEAAAGRKAALLDAAKWSVGSAITIRFLGGSAKLRERVRKVAQEWTDIAGLDFVFQDSGPADIRIAFQPGLGSWSYLGTQCRQIPEPKATMNFGWLTDDSDEAELRRVVLHEFGHALGMIHEHQNPKQPIKWNRAAVIHDLSSPPNDWDAETIENNMFGKYEGVTSTEIDRSSIMMYPIPASWLLQGEPVGLNGELSQVDKDFIASNYPKM